MNSAFYKSIEATQQVYLRNKLKLELLYGAFVSFSKQASSSAHSLYFQLKITTTAGTGTYFKTSPFVFHARKIIQLGKT